MKKLISLLMTITLCLNIFSIAIVNADSSDFVYPEEGNPYGYNFSLLETPNIDMDSQNGIITLFKEANLYHAETLEDIKAIEPYVNIEFIEADVPLNTPEYEDDNISLFSDTTETSYLIAKISYIPNQKYTGEAIEPEITVTHMNGTVLVKNVDYTVSFSNNTEIGVATVYVTGIGSYMGTIQGEFNITEEGAIEITNDMITPISDQEYTGKAITPDIVITDVEGNTLIKDTDYTVSYTNNIEIGTANVYVSGINNYTGTIQVEFNIVKEESTIEITSDMIAPVLEQEYTGKAVTPDVVITDKNGYILIRDIDYTVSYLNNVKIGLAYIIITGIGNYTGEVQVKFTINNPLPMYCDDVCMRGFWDNGIRGKGVKIAVLDSGIYREHEAFKGIDIEQGINVIALIANDTENLYNTSDTHHHGTAVTSVVCGRNRPIQSNNKPGLMDEATIVPYKICENGGGFYIAKAIALACEDGCDVINISYGGIGTTLALRKAIAQATKKGVIICAAAGNSGNEGSPLEYPAADKNVIGVGGFNGSSETGYFKADFSTANESVFVSAPGYAIIPFIYSASSYKGVSGTSIATPFITAAAAGVKQMRPETTTREFMEILKNTCVDIDEPGYDINTGWGMLNYENIYNYMMTNTDFSCDTIELTKDNLTAKFLITTYSPTNDYENRNIVIYNDSEDHYDNEGYTVYYTDENGKTTELCRDVDYELTMTNTDTPGKTVITLTGINEYSGSVQFEGQTQAAVFQDNRIQVTGISDEYKYTGEAIVPQITVKYDDILLQENTDYTVVCENNTNAGIATVKVKGIGNYCGTKEFNFNIAPKTLTDSKIVIEDIKSQNYIGEGFSISPEPTVKDGDKVLVRDVDYQLNYINNSDIGTATIEINGIGNYKDTAIKTFTIENIPVATETPTIKPTEMPISTTQPTSAPTESPKTTPESTDKPEISPVPTENDDYDIITSIEYDNIQKVLKFKAINNTENNIKACGIMIIKDEKGVLKAVYTLNDILVGENTKVVNMPQNEGYTAQFLVWDSLTNMKPIDRVKLSQYAE